MTLNENPQGSNVKLPLSLFLNYSEFPNSCFRHEFRLITNIFHMFINIWNCDLKQFRHQLLHQPYGFIFKTHLYFCLSAFCLINQNAGFDGLMIYSFFIAQHYVIKDEDSAPMSILYFIKFLINSSKLFGLVSNYGIFAIIKIG